MLDKRNPIDISRLRAKKEETEGEKLQDCLDLVQQLLEYV